MTWSTLAPYSSGGGGHNLTAVMMFAPPAGRFRPTLGIVIRPALWEGDALAWLAIGKQVTLKLGSGTEAGQLRVEPGGVFKISKAGRSDALCIKLPPVPGQQPGQHRATPCECDWHDTWLAITLPAWCRPKPAIPQPVLSPDAERRLNRQERAA